MAELAGRGLDMGLHLLGQALDHFRIAQAERGIFLHRLLDPFLLRADQAGKIATVLQLRESGAGMIQLHARQAKRFVPGEAHHVFQQGTIAAQGHFQRMAQMRDILACDRMFVHGSFLCRWGVQPPLSCRGQKTHL